MKFIYGNILDIKKGLILHQVNCMGVMGAGLALDIRNKYPKVWLDYKNHDSMDLLKLGNVVTTVIHPSELVYGSICGQLQYGRTGACYTDYNALSTAFFSIQTMKFGPIYIPWEMGCGLAGGNWTKVLQIIERFLPDATIVNPHGVIHGFVGKNSCLDTKYPVDISIEHNNRKYTFPSVENFYQAMKTENPFMWSDFAKKSPKDAATFGCTIQRRVNWEDIKQDVMKSANEAKFRIPFFASQLMSTGNVALVNGVGDTGRYWGTVEGEGNNHLGVILMKIRNNIKTGKTKVSYDSNMA